MGIPDFVTPYDVINNNELLITLFICCIFGINHGL